MESLKIKKSGNIYYVAEDYKSLIHHLGNFLTDDLSEWSIPFYKEWLESDDTTGSSNYSWLVKDGDNILIGFLYDSEEDFYENAFSINKNEFIKTIKKWVELYKQKPNEIHIIYENGKITMEGKN